MSGDDDSIPESSLAAGAASLPAFDWKGAEALARGESSLADEWEALDAASRAADADANDSADEIGDDDDVETIPLTSGGAQSAAFSPTSDSASREGAEVDPADAHFVAHLKRDPYLILHRSVYFLGMGANSAYYPFAIQLWTSPDGGGLDMREAGLVYACGHMSAMIFAPVLASVADRGEAWRRGVLVGGFAGQMIAILVMSQAKSFFAIAVMQAVIEGVASAVWTSMDSATQRLLLVTKGSTVEYGNTRAFGALGWGCLAVLYGIAFDRLGLRSGFALYCVAGLPATVIAYFVPLERRTATTAGRATALRALLRFDVLVIMIVVLVTAILLQVVDIYRFPFLSSIGADNTLLGSSIFITAVSEAPFFFITSKILDRISTKSALLVVLAGYALRFIFYSLIGEEPFVSPWWTMPAELAHGFTFALGWAASTQYVANLLPPELANSAQGLLAAVQWGFGSALGSATGGAIARAWGWRVMWRVFSALGLVTCLFLKFVGRAPTSGTAESRRFSLF